MFIDVTSCDLRPICYVLPQSFRPSTDSSSSMIFPDEDLPSLLSAVKVWCDWMLGNNDTWYPVVCGGAGW